MDNEARLRTEVVDLLDSDEDFANNTANALKMAADADEQESTRFFGGLSNPSLSSLWSLRRSIQAQPRQCSIRQDSALDFCSRRQGVVSC